MNFTDQLVEQSSLLKYITSKGSKGRKSLISGEMTDYTKDASTALTPADKSLFILLCVSYPDIFMLSENENDRRACVGVLNYICQTAKSLDGIQDKTLEANDVEWKTEYMTTKQYGRMTGATKEITLEIPTESSTYAVTNFINHWNNQVSDEHTGFGPYNGLDADYNNFSHTCALAYIKPNKNLTKVGYGALFFQAMPNNVPYSNLNGDRLSPGVTPLSLTFSVSMIDTHNLLVRELCESILAKYKAATNIDSALHGAVKNTILESVTDIEVDNLVEQNM